MSLFNKNKLLCNHIYQYAIYVIQKLGRDVKSIVLKLPSDQTISLRILNEKQGSTADEIPTWQRRSSFFCDNVDVIMSCC